jgi:hypothetical protein
MTALVIIAVLAVAGFAAFKISKSKEKLSNKESAIVDPVKVEDLKVEAVVEKKEVVAPKKELKLKEKKQPVVEKKKEEKVVKTTTAKPKAKKTNKKDK